MTVTDNAADSRFELEESGQVVFADYRRAPGRLIIDHVESPVSLRGSGAAGRLMHGVAAAARAAGERITPLCSYAAAWLQRHPEHADLLQPPRAGP
ncbi:MAG TPA: GNAT family N-acetyltransferase [Caulobacteraceae bacterium]|jgi:hypothetical protein|nr:GNAT family N-acetyltransferase [Caulobacteraceae bacterium]